MTILELLEIKHPIFISPMAGVSTPELAAEVSNQGALGALGLGANTPEAAKEITKNLSFEKNPIFRKWYTFEAMSGYKKFSNQKSVASICVEFNADTGAITKNIPVTSDGKSNFGSKPKVSSEVESISQKLKIFAAWKTGDGSPASVLRALPEGTDTFRGIILNELRNDKIANSAVNLNEEMEQLDEFAIMRKVFNKVKGLTSKATTWLNNLFTKIMKIH